MPKKSVKEKNLWERRHSLAWRVFRRVCAMTVALGVVSVIIGVGTYYDAVSSHYIKTAYMVSAEAAAMLQETADLADCVDKTMSQFHSLSEEELVQEDEEAYYEKFRFLESDENYQKILSVLQFIRENNEIIDVYLVAFDRDTNRIVYIADPEDREEMYCRPGEWRELNSDQSAVFLPMEGEEFPHITTNNQYGWMCTSGVPVTDQENSTVGYILTDLSMLDLLHQTWNYLMKYTIVLVILILLMTSFFSCNFKKTLVDPINRITEAAERYVHDRRSNTEVTDHFSRKVLNISTRDEVENLSRAMANMEKDIAEYEENLSRITAEKQRISTELLLAARIQEDMLPNSFPAFPERKEFDIFAVMDPAREVGGDFYDFFLIDDDHLCMVIADVSGKGVPASLFMMASQILLSNNARMGKSPSEILEDTNRSICSHNKEEMFVTVWLGILQISTGKLTAANAGHEYPVIRRADGGFSLYRDPHGFVLGGIDGMTYREYELLLEPGSKLFVYTDGLKEASDDNLEMFGTDRMLAALNKEAEASPEQILKNVRNAVDSFVRDAEQFDDLTMLCLEYIGQ